MTRRALWLLLVASAASHLSACRPRWQPQWPADNRLTIALESAPANLDPRLGTDQSSDRAFDLLLAGLVERNERGDLVGSLAESWEELDGGLRYRFHLRPGVAFHDGRPLTAADVAWTLGSVVDGSVASPKATAIEVVERVETVDPATVDVVLERPFGSLLVELTQSLGIVPAGTSPAQMNRAPVGAGPFRLVERGPESLVLAAFDGYFRGRPALDRVELKVVPDATVRALELMKGSVQLVVNDLPPDLVPRFRASPAFQVVEDPGGNYAYLGFNLEDPVVADVRVRRALALSLDRQLLVDTLWRGLGVTTETLLPPGLWARHDALPPIPHDPARAAALLEAAGHPDPDGPGPAPRLTLSYKTSNAEMAVLQAQILQAMAAEAGIRLDIRSYEFATFYDDVRRGNFQLFSLVRTGVTDPNLYRFVLHSRSLPPAGQNRGRYKSPEFDRLIDLAAGLTDREARRPLYREAQEILARDLPYLSLFLKKNVAVLAAPLSGYRNYLGAELTSVREVRWLRQVVGQPETAGGFPLSRE